jgi:hypothetical protein
MKRILPLAVLALAAACAGGPPPEGATTRTVFTNTHQVSAAPGDRSDVMTTTSTGITATTTMSVDSAMRALAAAYGILNLPVTLVDQPTHRVGNPHLAARYNLNGEPLSRFVNCGETMTSVRADREQVFFSIISQVKPAAEGGNTVETTVQAVAVDRTSGNSNGMIPCSTTGALESRIHRMALNAR